MNLEKKVQELENEISRLRKMAERDELTGCLRREALMSILDRRRKFGFLPRNMTLAIIDIDHFKNINDTFGHLSGDQVLKEVANLLLQNAPSGSLVCRMGGEEFVLLMPSTLDESLKEVETLRKILGERRIATQNGASVTVTFSAGLATWNSDEAMLEATAAADAALYAAKRNGRNQCTRAWRKVS